VNPDKPPRDTRPVDFARLLFPDFSLIACGFLLCRYTALDRSVWEKVDGLVYYFLFPVLLFQSIVRSPLDLREASSMMGRRPAAGLSGIAMAYLLPHLPGLRGHIDRARTPAPRRWRSASTRTSRWRCRSGWRAPRACS
jgi:malonate transporter